MVRHANFGSYHDLSPEGSEIIVGIKSCASHGEIVRHERQAAPLTPKHTSALAGLRAAMSDGTAMRRRGPALPAE